MNSNPTYYSTFLPLSESFLNNWTEVQRDGREKLFSIFFQIDDICWPKNFFRRSAMMTQTLTQEMIFNFEKDEKMKKKKPLSNQKNRNFGMISWWKSRYHSNEQTHFLMQTQKTSTLKHLHLTLHFLDTLFNQTAFFKLIFYTFYTASKTSLSNAKNGKVKTWPNLIELMEFYLQGRSGDKTLQHIKYKH